MPAYTLKIAIIGNVEVGKTKFCNLLTNTQSKLTYSPTVACRIIEYDTNIIGQSVDNKHSEEFEVTLEFWDTSGDLKYNDGWNAIKKNCNGIIIVYDESKMNESDLKMWTDNFAHKILRSKQCLILSMNDNYPPTIDQDSKLKKFKCIKCEFEENKLSQTTKDDVLNWAGIVFGYHPDAEFGVFD